MKSTQIWIEIRQLYLTDSPAPRWRCSRVFGLSNVHTASAPLRPIVYRSSISYHDTSEFVVDVGNSLLLSATLSAFTNERKKRTHSSHSLTSFYRTMLKLFIKKPKQNKRTKTKQNKTKQQQQQQIKKQTNNIKSKQITSRRSRLKKNNLARWCVLHVQQN